jgi:hypothetical protein
MIDFDDLFDSADPTPAPKEAAPFGLVVAQKARKAEPGDDPLMDEERGYNAQQRGRHPFVPIFEEIDDDSGELRVVPYGYRDKGGLRP